MKRQLELYIHIPFCVRKCNYCDFLSAPADEGTQRGYVDALLREIDFYGEQCDEHEVVTVYIGGGTPSWLQEQYIEQIVGRLYEKFCISPQAEISMECNPGTLTREKLLAYRACGINRLSMGLQSTMDDELKELGRIHTYEQFLRNYALARECDFTNINIDLMSALPYQTAEKYLTSLKRVINLRPEHISAYSLIIEEGTPFYEKYQAEVMRREAGETTSILPNEDTEYEIYKQTQQLLEEKGYHHYEISNYAKKGYECRHNIGYWRRVDYLGLGLGAASLMGNVRYTNTGDIHRYIEETQKLTWQKINETEASNLHEAAESVSRRAQMEEYMFLGLRMTDGISRDEFSAAFHTTIDAVYGTVLHRLQSQGLLELSQGRIFLSDRGMDISNYVLSEFLLDNI